MGNIRILFQGDSITDGNRYKDPELAWDKNHQMGHSYAFAVNAFLGSKYPQKDFEFINRGISGNTTLDIINRMQADIIDIKPDIFSLYVGVNDASPKEENPDGRSPADFERNYRIIVDNVKKNFPDIKLIFVSPFIYERHPMTEAHVQRMKLVKEYVPVIKKLSEEYGAVFIELQPEFDKMCKVKPVEYWCWDGVHPTENGHGIIARLWIEGFKKIVSLED